MLLRKLSLLLVPALLVAASVLPGRAQEDLTGRYAFADTTLLRDTLGLTFRGLFRLADSLEIAPDTLRAHSIRYRLPLSRLVAIADSMHVPVDSVGVTLLRERFNPLAARTAGVNDFTYSTTYNLFQTRSSWLNGADYNFVYGALFIRNVTTIVLDRLETSGATTQIQTRDSNTEGGWRLNPDYSVGARALLYGYDSDDPTTVSNVADRRSEYQLSLRTRQRPSPRINSELNLFAGMQERHDQEQDKHGWSAEANGRFRQTIGAWFVHELNGKATASRSRVLLATASNHENTHDLIGNLNGNLSLFNNARVGFKTTYALQGSDVADANLTTGVIDRLGSNRLALDAALRSRLGPDGFVTLTQRIAHNEQITALNGPSARNTSGTTLDARTTYWGWGVEGRFSLNHANGESPELSATGGYGEKSQLRNLEGSLTRRLFGHLDTRINARIGLNSYRYHVIGVYPTPPVTRDQALQSYQIDGTYVFTKDFNSGLMLEVMRNQLVNIPSASTSANNTLRTYRAEWRWTYRLLAGLTASQRNTLGANYTSYNFLTGADRVALDYGTLTTLNAVLTPRLSIDLTHSGQVQPSGGWTRLSDGEYVFRPADESRIFSLLTRFQYTPSPLLSLTFWPKYRSTSREGTLNGVTTPQRDNRNLTFEGTASLNIPIGSRGTLSGNVGRQYYADRSTDFSSGVAEPSPLSEQDYWTGSLQFSWKP
ncbi:MAG TPA: hypothetical protein VFQ05_10560 [Candidatus Eisenbacteria bacterium]|nr:hypothetical protein [Candidatus Eisenbacteria bacterium]